jgi:hypothetical protein
VLDIAKNPPEEDPYSLLKELLPLSHMLMNSQKIKKMQQMDTLGECKLSELLA